MRNWLKSSAGVPINIFWPANLANANPGWYIGFDCVPLITNQANGPCAGEG